MSRHLFTVAPRKVASDPPRPIAPDARQRRAPISTTTAMLQDARERNRQAFAEGDSKLRQALAAELRAIASQLDTGTAGADLTQRCLAALPIITGAPRPTTPQED